MTGMSPPSNYDPTGDMSPGETHVSRMTRVAHDKLVCTCLRCRQWRYKERKAGIDRPEPDWRHD